MPSLQSAAAATMMRAELVEAPFDELRAQTDRRCSSACVCCRADPRTTHRATSGRGEDVNSACQPVAERALGVPMRCPAPAASSKPAGDFVTPPATAPKAVGMRRARSELRFTSSRRA
jgi:hypothetical protein